MLKIENQCCDCGLPCEGDSCRYRNVPVFYCDKCKMDCGDEVFDVDGDVICEDCLKKRFAIDIENWEKYK